MNPPPIQFGLETEIGIAGPGGDAEGAGESDVVLESIALVRSATQHGAWMCWDYGSEDPHVDMRGFRVHELRQDTDESSFFTQDAERDLSYIEIKSDLALGNGGRFYNDHAHPEYCTPECDNLDDLVAHDRAGERILMACARRLAEQSGQKVRLYKNNTDFNGHSYGCHENYLIPRALEWETLVQAIQAFLVTRQVFAGAGKFAFEAEDRLLGHGFQISQRSDFFSELQSVDTMQRRPIINTRDEPHANPKKFRRFHVILGDANMSPFATRLKVGLTALVLEAILRAPQLAWPLLADPLGALHAVSRQWSQGWPVNLRKGRPTTALDVQREYLGAVRQNCDLSDPAKSALVADWQRVLDDLGTDFTRCRDRLDWVAKHQLVREFQARQNLSNDDPWLASLDLEYHRLDLEEGLYYGLEQSGGLQGVPPERAVMRAMTEPPPTRALIRGKLIQKFAESVVAAQWDHVILQGRSERIKVSLLDLFSNEDITRLERAIHAAATPDDLQTAL